MYCRVRQLLGNTDISYSYSQFLQNGLKIQGSLMTCPRSYPWNRVCMLSCFSHVWLFLTLWIVAYQAPLSMGFSRQEYWSGLPCPPPGDLPDLGIEPASLMSPASAGGFWTINATWKAQAFFPSLPHPLQCYLLGQWAAVCGPAAEIRENCLNFPE